MNPAEAVVEIERALAEHDVIFWERFKEIREIIDRAELTEEQRKQVESHRDHASRW